MDESKSDPSSDKKLDRLVVRTDKYPRHSQETHGLRDDIDVNTPVSAVKGPNVFERVKEEFEAVVEAIHSRKGDKNQDSPSSSVEKADDTFAGSKNEKQNSVSDKKLDRLVVRTDKYPRNSKETHGLRDDIDVNTPVSAVKGPNVFERVKEEFEAVVEAIHSRKGDKNQDSPSSSVEKADDPFTGSKNEKQNSVSDYKGSPRHYKETHGRADDIDADIPVSEFKGPSIFHRAKEEIEAIVDTIHTKKDSDTDVASPKKEGGFRASVKEKIQKIRKHD